MNLAKIAVENKAVTYFAMILLVLAGLASFFNLGQLEDPEFTVRTAAITTQYPGASPEEVELEVTDRIELAIQEMPQLDYIESFSRAGFSLIKVNIQAEYWSDRLPQVWDELRRKIRNVESQLPPGAGRPVIGDDFGDVFGFQLAMTGDGFTYAELEEYAKAIKKEISLIDGVARVDLWGARQKIIYLDVSETQLSALGVSAENFLRTLQFENMVVDAGGLDLMDYRFRIAPTGYFRTPLDIGDLQIRPSLPNQLQADTLPNPDGRTSELIRIRDIATVRRGYAEPPFNMLRQNGDSAIGLSISNASGVNIVDVGRAIEQHIDELKPLLPVGIELHKIHWQSDIVSEAVNGFLINFAQAVGIVLIILTLAMGWRMGLIIGIALVATILGTFILMALFGIDLQRMSLGALVIALGMMVDNAIVVADGMTVRLQKGMDRTQAAIESAAAPSMPLLGATVIAVMAFYPIGGSVEDVGEYCQTLFSVVGISLMFSWLVSVTITPINCIALIKVKESDSSADPYGGKLFTAYRGVLTTAIRRRWVTLGIMVGLLVVSVYGFGHVKQQFFPFSSMPKYMIDYWAPEGTRIEQVANDIRIAEEKLIADDRVEGVASFIGVGPPRFYLPVDPENPYQSFAQLIVNTHDFRDIDALIAETDPIFTEMMPQALVLQRPYGVGPTETWKLEVRISGPAEADPAVLRGWAERVEDAVSASPFASYVTNDWRQQVQKIVPDYNQERARWASITRDDLAGTTKRAYDGATVGLYRENDNLIPIVLRHVDAERRNVAGIEQLQVVSALSTETVPLAQVVTAVVTEWEDPLIWRRDRRRTVTVQSNPLAGETFPTMRADVIDQIDAIAAELPRGYTLEWGGEFESAADAKASLIPGLVPAAAIMLFIIVALFNAFRPPLIIVATIPFALIGITAGLLLVGVPFGFMALLGAMSLSGMMIKNAIVLLDEVNANLALGKSQYDSVVDAAVSRLRPVFLAAATTVLGVIPLLQDVFWVAMATTIMAGLTFGTVLTMILVPVLYAIMFRLKTPDSKAAAAPAAEAAEAPA